MDAKHRARRHHGTFYYAGVLIGWRTCGHKHATARAAIKCRDRMTREGVRYPRLFEVLHGVYPGKLIDDDPRFKSIGRTS